MTASVEQSAIAVAEYYVDLGQRLAEARIAAGMSQDELGARMGGLTRSGISNVETGRRAVLAHNVVRYAAVLAVEPLRLLTGHRAAPEPPQGRTELLRAER